MRSRGENNPRAKLTEDMVREIRRRAATEPKGALAREYGVARSNVQFIVSGSSWAHVR